MEQLVARRAHNPKVASSSLAPATKTIKRLNYYIVNRFFLIRLIYLRKCEQIFNLTIKVIEIFNANTVDGT